jgi:hypothetical protein
LDNIVDVDMEVVMFGAHLQDREYVYCSYFRIFIVAQWLYFARRVHVENEVGAKGLSGFAYGIEEGGDLLIDQIVWDHERGVAPVYRLELYAKLATCLR